VCHKIMTADGLDCQTVVHAKIKRRKLLRTTSCLERLEQWIGTFRTAVHLPRDLSGSMATNRGLSVFVPRQPRTVRPVCSRVSQDEWLDLFFFSETWHGYGVSGNWK